MIISTLRSKKFWILLVLVLAGWLGYHIFWFGNITVVNGSDFSSILVDGKLLPNNLDLIKLRPGQHKISARGALVKPVDTEISVGAFSNKPVTLPYTAITPETAIKQIVTVSLQPGMAVGKTKLLENNTWLVALIYSPQGDREGYTNIYNFDGFVWKKFDSGTGFELEGYTSTGFPDSVNDYLRGPADE